MSIGTGQTVAEGPAETASVTPTVAIVVNTYNDAEYLPQAFASIAAQSVRADEVIVVDDGSVVSPEPVVRDTFPQARFIRRANGGLAAARNTGLAAARTHFILFLDADDLLHPDAVATGLAAFERQPAAGMVYGAHRRIDGTGQVTLPYCFHPVGDNPFESLLRGNCIGMHATVLYHRQRLVSVGGFNEALRRCEDYDAYFRMARAFPVGCHPELVADYCWHGDNMSNDYPRMLESALAVQGTQREFAGQAAATARAWREGRSYWRQYYAFELLAQSKSLSNRIKAFRMAPTDLPTHYARKAAAKGFEILPPGVRYRIRRAMGRTGNIPVGQVDFGSFDTTEPVSRDFGFDRGLPVDRFYIERFLSGHDAKIRGRVLEIGDAAYSRRFGTGITRQDVLHVTPGAPEATIIGDLCDPSVLPGDTFDCMILTQTIHLIYDMSQAVRQSYRALRPGGTVLATVPGITPVDHGEWGGTWYWSLTALAAKRLFADVFGADAVEVEAHGNVYAATCFLQGLALAEVDEAKLAVDDAAYPVSICICATKPAV